MKTARYNLQVQKFITALSVFLFVFKITAYYLTHSVSILSDALESIVNILAGGIGLYSLYIAAKPSDKDHPYGHGKAEFVSAAVEGALIVAAGFLIIYETIRTFIGKASVVELNAGILIISFTAIINYVAGSICLRIGKRNDSLALQASGKHLQTDTYSTLAVVAGLLIILFTKIYWLDKLFAFGIGIFIIYNGYKIVKKSLAGIMDQQDMKLLDKIVSVLNQNRSPNWVDLHNLRVIKYGSQLHIDCHLTLPWYVNMLEAHKEIDALIECIQNSFGKEVEFFVHTDGCLPFSCPLCDKNDCLERKHPFKQKVEWKLENLLLNKRHRL